MTCIKKGRHTEKLVKSDIVLAERITRK